MRLHNKKKLIAGILLVALMVPQVTFGFSLTGITNSNVPVSDKDVLEAISGDTGGILGSFNDAFGKVNGAINQIQSASCVTAEVAKILNAVNQVDKWTFGGLTLLTSGGENAWAVGLQSQITTLNKTSDCLKVQIDSLKAQRPVSVIQGQQMQAMLDDLTKQKTTIDARLDILKSQYKVATQSIWKTIMVKILITTTQAVTQRLIADMTNKYKIQNVQQYADALASQAYTAQLIRANAGSKSDQLIIRSIIANPALRNEIDNDIYERAADALSYNGEVFDPAKLDPTDPHFYEKLAATGNPEANVPFMKTVYNQQAQAIQATALENAKGEIAIGSGLKAPRTCSNAVSQQESIDQQYRAVTKQLQDRWRLLNSLQEAKDLGQPVKDEDIAKAKKDYETVRAQYKGLPNGYKDVALDICKDIVSPAAQVDKVIDKLLVHYSQSLSNYNDNNLPLFANMISDIGSKLTTKLVFGDNIDSKVITTAKGFDQALPTAANYLQYLHDESVKDGVEFRVYDNRSVPDSSDHMSVTVEWSAMAVDGATGVEISAAPEHNPLLFADLKKQRAVLGSVNVDLYIEGTYTFTLKTMKNTKVYNTQSLQINYKKLPLGKVSGAQSQQELPIRGYVTTEILPRGRQ